MINIENVTKQKLLGVHVDRHLTWQTHIEETCLKLKSKIMLLKRILFYLNDEMKQLFYNSYIMSTFDYCCAIWGTASKTNISQIAILQKRAAKIILQKPMRTPTRELFKQLKWLTFENRCKYPTAVIVYKCIQVYA